ncbi:M15 family metallopeptidase [Brevibacillus fulvus]|uniref:D-alanyl-D-alanine dipeptidase n=1 Tax=Brevibacillus fulvus TaxID=1125967 RepID=A0A939BWW0_9BACL|nr:M15 family metallopeptidase [Brevibacillus fulvus]MBM7592201.1 D-alanyl-D-alanine dipeptidase [Brevibacillus fulvus]
MLVDHPIPIAEQTTTFSPQLRESGEPLIALSTLSEKIKVYPYYFKQGHSGAKEEAFLRTGAAQLLKKAAEQLPEGHFFVVLDGWRPFQVQQSLYERFKQSLLEQGLSAGEELERELCKFVAKPTQDIRRPAPHLSGGAIDLTIATADSWLDMGTAFDDFSERAATCYFETLPVHTPATLQIRENRRMLYHLMVEAGFVNYAAEWWHYEFGTLSWAQKKRAEAIYGGVLEVC